MKAFDLRLKQVEVGIESQLQQGLSRLLNQIVTKCILQ